MSLIKSKQRVADHGEVFTPEWMVEAMLDLVKHQTEIISSTFLEPACGSGNFLVPILKRKLAAVDRDYRKYPFKRQRFALVAVMSIYGIEIQEDNISECRANLLSVLAEHLDLKPSDDLYRAASSVLSLNIVHGDAMEMLTCDKRPLTFAEWGYLEKAAKYQRQDFLLKGLTKRAEVPTSKEALEANTGNLFSEEPAFEDRGKSEPFTPIRRYKKASMEEIAEWINSPPEPIE
ncbi:DNA methyltransferase [Armatimonas rosea]|uniref:site-specific DNA-methyltransferase (adenine-specific) n=1 Tax=Armatimonas rosea TaxID=685828 RepID=A0A7W9SRC4_ARMRO|nr:DNA methyltransferase [Armatimonas rosea]MBB6050828.1 hypothetical protein [Armatimonas rosea]